MRTRHGHTLTSRAEALRGPLERALRAIEEVVSAATFDPKTTTRVFRVASTDYGVVAVIARIAARLTVEAPGVRIDIAPFTTDTLVQLEGGVMDLALWTDDALPPDFHYRRLFKDSYVCVLRRGHPLLRVQANRVMRALSEYPQVIALYPSGAGLVSDEVLAELGIPGGRVALRTPYFSSAGWLLGEGDLVMCMPARMADRLISTASGLARVELPGSKLCFEYRCLWHARAHQDPGTRWLRELIRVAAED